MTDETTSIIQKYSQAFLVVASFTIATAYIQYKGVDEEDADNILATCNAGTEASLETKNLMLEMLTIYKTKLDIEK